MTLEEILKEAENLVLPPVAGRLIRAAWEARGAAEYQRGYKAGQLACENHDYKRGYEAGKRDAILETPACIGCKRD